MVTIGDMSTTGIFQEFHAAIVPVRDVEKSNRWYQETLGLAPRREVPGLVVYGLGGTAHLCLYQSESELGDGESGPFANFRSADIDATHKLLTERGVECSEIRDMPQLRFFAFHDPDRNRIHVCEYGPDWLE